MMLFGSEETSDPVPHPLSLPTRGHVRATVRQTCVNQVVDSSAHSRRGDALVRIGHPRSQNIHSLRQLSPSSTNNHSTQSSSQHKAPSPSHPASCLAGHKITTNPFETVTHGTSALQRPPLYFLRPSLGLLSREVADAARSHLGYHCAGLATGARSALIGRTKTLDPAPWGCCYSLSE